MTDGEKESLQNSVPELFDEAGNLDSSRLTGDTATKLNNVIDHPQGVLNADTQVCLIEAGASYGEAYQNAHD